MEGLEISGVERKRNLAASTGFDFLEESQADFDLDVGAGDIDIEEDYLGMLKTQRERMEKLEKGYTEKETQLDREIEKVVDLTTEIERLKCFVIYKEKYDNLKLDYSDLLTKYNIQKQEFEIVRQELDDAIISNNLSISKLKSELKKWKEVSTLNINHLEESLKDKEDEMRKIRNDFKDKEDELCQENNNLRILIDKIKSQIEIETNLQNEFKEKAVFEAQSRENFILNLEKTLDQVRKANIEIKSESDKIQEEMMSRELELSSLCSKLKNQINIQKKSIGEKEEKTSELESELKKSGVLVKDLRKEIMEIKADYQKTCDLYELQNTKIQNERDSETCRLQTFINELKYEIEELMEVKNHLLVENKKITSTLKRKEQSDRQRKQLLHTEFKEIERISRVIDRLE